MKYIIIDIRKKAALYGVGDFTLLFIAKEVEECRQDLKSTALAHAYKGMAYVTQSRRLASHVCEGLRVASVPAACNSVSKCNGAQWYNCLFQLAAIN
jgi:hypothetical protein